MKIMSQFFKKIHNFIFFFNMQNKTHKNERNRSKHNSIDSIAEFNTKKIVDILFKKTIFITINNTNNELNYHNR